MASLPLSEAFELYRQDHIIMSNQSPKTEEAYLNTSLLIVRFMGDIDICDLTFEDVRDWRNWLLGWQKPDTARGNIMCLRMVLKFLRKRGYPVMDYENIPVAKRVKRKIEYLLAKEVEEFIAEAARRTRGYPEITRLRNVAIIYLLWATGLRNGELCALNRNSIRNKQFTVIGKSTDERLGFINDRAQNAIDAYLEMRTDNNKALFISDQTGERIVPKTIQRVFRDICNRSRFEKIHPHTIRHSYGTFLLSKGVNLRYIADLMGHKDMNTTRMYTHYENPQLRSVYESAYNVT